jgi:hypothetical protein
LVGLGSAAIAIHFVQVAVKCRAFIRGLSAPVFEGIDFEEKKSLV